MNFLRKAAKNMKTPISAYTHTHVHGTQTAEHVPAHLDVSTDVEVGVRRHSVVLWPLAQLEVSNSSKLQAHVLQGQS